MLMLEHLTPLNWAGWRKEMSKVSAKLVNYTVQTYMNERDMNFAASQWQERKKEYLPRLKVAGLKKMTGMRIWNKEGAFSVGWVFEYESEKAFKNCRPIWQEIDRIEQSEYPLKTLSFRGVVIDEEDL